MGSDPERLGDALFAGLRQAGLAPQPVSLASLGDMLLSGAAASSWLAAARRQPAAWHLGACQWVQPLGRLAWWRRDLVPLRTIVSSRPPRSATRFDASTRLRPWFDAIRALVAQQRGGSALLTVESTAVAAPVSAAARAMRVEHRQARVVGSWSAWGRRIRGGEDDILISPPLSIDVASPLPPADQVAWQLAQQVDIIHVRAGGAWERQLSQVGADEPRRLRSVTALSNSRDARREVLRVGGTVLGFREPPAGYQTESKPRRVPAARRTNAADSRLAPLWRRAPVLIHCTRGCDGPWPDETWQQYWLAMLTGRGGDRSARAALERIARQGRLSASARCVRGGAAVVCLSAASPEQLSEPKYRRHRRRWDGEPWGVAIDRQWLARLGARPVIYGDDAVWRQLDPQLAPFFQSAGAAGRWRAEHEWRFPGDLLLDQFPPRSVEFFVPTPEDAEGLQRHCPWRVRSLS